MTGRDWPTKERPARAFIGPTGLGTYGVVWRDFPAMTRRGGYSGPYDTVADAVSGVDGWMRGWGLPLDAVRMEQVEKLPDPFG